MQVWAIGSFVMPENKAGKIHSWKKGMEFGKACLPLFFHGENGFR